MWFCHGNGSITKIHGCNHLNKNGSENRKKLALWLVHATDLQDNFKDFFALIAKLTDQQLP